MKKFSGLVNGILNKYIIYDNTIKEYNIKIINYEIIIYSSKNKPLYRGKWKNGIYQLYYIYINENLMLISNYSIDTNHVYFFEIHNVLN
jgi:hypothetical protein